jgi:hypothetical protein
MGPQGDAQCSSQERAVLLWTQQNIGHELDWVITGGRVIDPETGPDAVLICEVGIERRSPHFSSTISDFLCPSFLRGSRSF